MWKKWWRTICIRGAGTTRLTWVKSHTGVKEVDAGTISAEDSYGNDAADKQAEIGAKIDGVADPAEMLGKRHAAYTSTMARIRKYIGEVMLQDKQLRELEDLRANPFREQVQYRLQAACLNKDNAQRLFWCGQIIQSQLHRAAHSVRARHLVQSIQPLR